MSCADIVKCQTFSEKESIQILPKLLVELIEAVQGGATAQSIIQGFTGTATTITDFTATFASPVNSVSIWSGANEIVQATIIHTGGTQSVYVSPGGTVNIKLEGANKITSVTLLSGTSDYLTIVNGVDGGV